MWLGSVIDRWDEAAAAEDDVHKHNEAFAVGASLTFPNLPSTAGLAAFSDAVRAAMAEPRNFYAAPAGDAGRVASAFDGGWLTFPSPLPGGEAGNDIAHAFILESDRRPSDAVLLIPHWNAPQDTYLRLARRLHRMGYTTALLILPYHHQRSRPGSAIADFFVSANLGRTIGAVRQAVADAFGVLNWLESRGCRRFHVVGASLGSCIAGLLGAFDNRVHSTSLLLTAGRFADVVWTGRATRHVAAAFREAITLDQLRVIWSIISLEPFVEYYRRPLHDMLILSASRDAVMLPHLTIDFVAKLRAAGVPMRHASLPCGHYSIGMLPFSILATIRVLSFLSRVTR